MAVLTYSMEVVGRRVVESELASLERRFVQHSRKLSQIGASAGKTAATGSRASRDPIFGPGRKEFDASLRAREKAELQSAQRLSRAKDSLDRQRSRALMQQYAAQERAAAKAVADRVAFVKSTFGNGISRVTGAVGAVGKAGIAAVGLGGAALAGAAVNQAIRTDEIARRLSIAGRAPGERGVDPATLQKEFTQTAIRAGFNAEDIATATQAYVAKTGDLDAARRFQGVLATTAQASGATPEDTFKAAADLSTKLDIKSVKDMTDAFAILSQQGKKGAFELKAMASEFPEVLGSAATAGVKGVSGARDVGALMQIARDTSGSDSEASTAVNAMFRQLGAKSKDIQSGKAFGGRSVQVFEGGDATKPMRNFVDVLADIIDASRGDITQLQETFDVRGKKAIDPLITAYRSARNGALSSGATSTQAHEAGRKALTERFSGYRDVSADFSEVQRDASDAMKATSVQLTVAFEQLKSAVASQLMPELTRLVPVLAELAPYVGRVARAFVDLLSWLTANPLKGLGAALALSIGAELVKARLGAVLAGGLQSILAGYSAGGVRGATGALTPKSGAGSIGGAALSGLALGASVAAVIYSEGVGKYEAGEGKMSTGGQALNEVRDAKVGDLDRVRALIAEQRKRVEEAGRTDVIDDVLDWGGASNKKTEQRTQQAFLDEMVKKANALQIQAAEEQKAAAAALTEAAGKFGGVKPNTSDRPTGVKGN